MLVFDQLKKNDPQLRLLAVMLAGGLAILLAGLWWVQIVSVREYRNHLVTQQFRTIRVPAVRGEILDREGRVLAENQPRYNLCLYLDDFREEFKAAYQAEYARATNARAQFIAGQEKLLGRALTKVERRKLNFGSEQLQQMAQRGRLTVGAQVFAKLSAALGEPLTFDPKDFESAYQKARALPYPVLTDLTPQQIARFQEKYPADAGVDLELQPVRYYPNGTLAAHLLGELRRDNSSIGGELSFFNYRLPDYLGVTGVEGQYDAELHGRAGQESVHVNNFGFRQSEDLDNAPQPGRNVVLTLDADIQRAAEKALLEHQGAKVNGAVVVMDVRSGDVLAMASSPTFDPNDFAQGISHADYQQIQQLAAEKNRATYENYAPGSIFKTVVALAALEKGLNTEAIYNVEPDPNDPHHGCYMFSPKYWKRDTASPGKYNFQRAFIHSSNSYFINAGLETAGIEAIIRMGEEFHLGERAGYFPSQETPGGFPTLERVRQRNWRDGDTANVCIGQGEIDVTPLQMAVMISAIANGGAVLVPRFVERIESPDPLSGGVITNFPAGIVRNRLTVHPRSLKIVREAMRADVASSEGTGQKAAVPGLNICAKTGTAQRQDEHNHFIGYNFWFASFAPYENPRYAVVVMVQGEHGSGGETCAPIAHDIYEVIARKANGKTGKTLAATN